MTLWADAHIFVYHRFGDSRYPSTDTTKNELTREFEYFKQNNYKIITLDRLVAALKHKEKIPDNWVVLTIDDNFKSFYQNGLPIFKKYNYPFTLFVYVKATDKKYADYLSWGELKEIQKYGSLAFHSYAHGHLTYMSDQMIRDDFKKGLAIFEEQLHFKPNYFSYPFGEFTERVKKVAKSFGFEAIINQNIGAVGKDSDIYDLDRGALVGKTNLQYLLSLKSLKATWIEPLIQPKDNILRHVTVQTQSNAKKATVYVTHYGWSDAPVSNGLVDQTLNKELTDGRNRIIIKIGNKISTKLLIKDNYGIK